MSERKTITLNYAYSCDRPRDWGPDVDDQIRRQVRLWNRLVRLEKAHRTLYRRLVGEDECVARLEAALATVKTDLKKNLSDRTKLRKQRKSKKIVAAEYPELENNIIAAYAKIKECKARLKVARVGAREARKDRIDMLNARLDAAVKRARKLAAHHGLWWGNYNAVVRSYLEARAKSRQHNTELRTRRYDGSGRLTCQIQGGMTWEEAGGDRTEVRIAGPDRRSPRNHVLLFTAAANGRASRRYIELPMRMHRPLPPDAVIKSVSLHRRSAGPGLVQHTAVFSVETSAPEPLPPTGHRAAVDIGWRVTRNGLRVAVLVDDTGLRVEHVYLPRRIQRRFWLVDEIMADCAAETAVIRAEIIDLPFDHVSLSDEMRLAVGRFRRACERHSQYAGDLVLLHRAWPAGWQKGKRLALERFLAHDLRERRRLAQTRNHAILARRDWMRCVIAGWLRRYDEIMIDGAPLQNQKVTSDGDESPLPDTQRRTQAIAAVGELRAWLADSGARKGRRIVTHIGKSTWTCHVCSHVVRPANPAELNHQCVNGHMWDQDENAARNMLATLTLPVAAE